MSLAAAVTKISDRTSPPKDPEQTERCRRVYDALCANNDLVSSIHTDSDTDYEKLSAFLIDQVETLTKELTDILVPVVMTA